MCNAILFNTKELLMKKKLVAATVGLLCALAQAQTDTNPFSLVGSIGFRVGGGDIPVGKFSNGNTYGLNAGTGGAYSVGVSYALSPKVDLQASIGYEGTAKYYNNGLTVFDRLVPEALAFYNFSDKYRLGAGIRKARNIELSGAGVESAYAGQSFKSKPGFVLEGQYDFKPKTADRNVEVAAYTRLVTDRFTNNASSETIYADHIGIGFAFNY
jgi:hypothetical protein